MSGLDLILPDGLDQPGYIETINGQDSAVVAANLTADTVYVARVRVKKAILISTMHIYIGAALGNVALGVCTGTLSGGLTRIAATASTLAAGTNALQSIALTAAVTLQPGIDYWFTFGSTGGGVTLTVGRSSGIAAITLTIDTLARTGSKASAWSSGLPASLSSLAASSVTVWIGAS